MWARVNNGVVEEVIEFNPNNKFAPRLVWVKCPTEVKLGWLFDGQNFTQPEPSNPLVIRDWAKFARLLNGNTEWLRLQKDNGAASTLARYVAEKDVDNARAYYQFLDSEGDLSFSLKLAINQAATECNLGDLLNQLTSP